MQHFASIKGEVIFNHSNDTKVTQCKLVVRIIIALSSSLAVRFPALHTMNGRLAIIWSTRYP